MSDTFRVRPIGDLDVLTPLLTQLRSLGAVEIYQAPALILVGTTTMAEADLTLLNLSPRLRRRAVIVGIEEHLDFYAIPGSFTALLERMQVLGSLPADCAATPTIRTFVGAHSETAHLEELVGAAFWRLGPSHHKVWTGLPPISAAAFLIQLVRAIETTAWFDGPPVRRQWSYY